MITVLSEHAGVPCISHGVEEVLIRYVRDYGQIVSLDRWAIEWGLTPYWVRFCAKRAAMRGVLKLTRLHDRSGRPYRVTLEEERHHETHR